MRSQWGTDSCWHNFRCEPCLQGLCYGGHQGHRGHLQQTQEHWDIWDKSFWIKHAQQEGSNLLTQMSPLDCGCELISSAKPIDCCWPTNTLTRKQSRVWPWIRPPAASLFTYIKAPIHDIHISQFWQKLRTSLSGVSESNVTPFCFYVSYFKARLRNFREKKHTFLLTNEKYNSRATKCTIAQFKTHIDSAISFIWSGSLWWLVFLNNTCYWFS